LLPLGQELSVRKETVWKAFGLDVAVAEEDGRYDD